LNEENEEENLGCHAAEVGKILESYMIQVSYLAKKKDTFTFHRRGAKGEESRLPLWFEKREKRVP
jgi:hypothetical protein